MDPLLQIGVSIRDPEMSLNRDPAVLLESFTPPPPLLSQFSGPPALNEGGTGERGQLQHYDPREACTDYTNN